MRQAIFLLLILTQLMPWPIIAANMPRNIRTITINKTGEWGDKQEAVYSDLTRRVQKWVENIESLDVQIAPSSKLINKGNLGRDKVKLDLMESSQSLLNGLLKGKDKSALKSIANHLRDMRTQAAGQGELGPEIQTSLFAEGALYWSNNNFSAATETLRRAIRIQPKGQLPSIVDWDDSDWTSFNSDAFESFVSSIQSREMRSCSLRIETNVSPVVLKINGFLIENTGLVNLVPGDLHHLEVQSPGFELKKSMIGCQSSGSQLIKVELQKQRKSHSRLSTDLDKNYQGGTMILIEPKKEEFKLLLYTPGKDYDEIPLTHPLKIADLKYDSIKSTGPILTDAAIEVFEKHKLLAANFKVNMTEPQIRHFSLEGVSEESTQMGWLKSPVFWGIVGGVVLGGAITYFAKRNQNSSISSNWE